MKKISVIRLLAVCMTFCWVSCKAKKTIVDVKVNDTTQQQTASSKASSGMKGTYIKVINDVVFAELEEIKKDQGINLK